MFSAVLSKPVCSPGGCHGNSQTAADFAPASSGDCERQRGGLRVRNLSRSAGKNLQTLGFLRLLIRAGVCVFEDFSKLVLISGFNRDSLFCFVKP